MKYLFMVALVALCLGSVGAAQADDGWTVADQELPAALEWDGSYESSVTALNSGTTSWAEPDYDLQSVDGPTSTAQCVDRWGVSLVPVEGVTVAPAAEYEFHFSVVAPPMTTLLYGLPLTPTSVAAGDTLDCNWILASHDTLIPTDEAVQATAITRFPDDQPGTAGAWALFEIEELAGRVPIIVGGYPDGSYQPTWQVTRNQMAVFVQRAMKLPLSNYTGGFADLTPGDWADDEIQTCLDAGIVQGYPGDPLPYYLPNNVVDRGQMAVFIARGLAGGDSAVPSGPVSATFPDVQTDYWAYKYIEYAAAHNVVRGYPSGDYLPGVAVDRGQMAVFVYRGFVMPTGSAVVLGGPAITGESPAWQSCLGWTSDYSGSGDIPGFAYVLLDAARLSTDLAPLDITFELRGPETPTPTYTESLDAGEIQNAIDAVTSSGGSPYLVVYWQLPGEWIDGLDEGGYELVTFIDGHELARRFQWTLE